MGTGVIVLGAVFDAKPHLVAAVTPDLGRAACIRKLVKSVARRSVAEGVADRISLRQVDVMRAGWIMPSRWYPASW